MGLLGRFDSAVESTMGLFLCLRVAPFSFKIRCSMLDVHYTRLCETIATGETPMLLCPCPFSFKIRCWTFIIPVSARLLSQAGRLCYFARALFHSKFDVQCSMGFHSKFDVQCSMLDVHFPVSPFHRFTVSPFHRLSVSPSPLASWPLH